MRKFTSVLVTWGLALVALSGQAVAAPVFGADEQFASNVFCDDRWLGRIEIDHYRTYKDAATSFGGVQIGGQFNGAADGWNLRWIQAITVDDDPLLWRGDEDSLPEAPYIDTPPGGYVGANNAFDHLVYYDEGEFPDFFDQPSTSLFTIKDAGPISVFFETWLVCVCEEMLGDDDQLASDDFYHVAPLLGFVWGYTGTYLGDLPPAGDTLNDFEMTKLPFAWLSDPTPDWLSALDQTYGAGEITDRFNVEICDCEECPEPSSLVLAGLGLLGMLLVRRRAQRPTA